MTCKHLCRPFRPCRFLRTPEPLRRCRLLGPWLLLAALALFPAAAPALAAPWDGIPKIFLHLTTTTVSNACAERGAGYLADCRQGVVSGDLAQEGVGPYYFAYLVAARGTLEGLAGLQCGIEYQGPETIDDMTQDDDRQGVDIFGWTLCATLQFTTPSLPGQSLFGVWPEPHGGNLITWDWTTRCQAGETAVAGYFYLGAYSADILAVTARPVDRAAKVADCTNEEYPLVSSDLGYLAFGFPPVQQLGCNPCVSACVPVAVQSSTWSRIKLLGR